MMPLLYIVVPCRNCADIIEFSVPFFLDKIEQLIGCGKISYLSRILFVDNESNDETFEKIKKISKEYTSVEGIKLGKRVDYQKAVTAGINEARKRCDICVVTDQTCKNDINAIDRMIEEYENGAAIVFGREKGTKTHITNADYYLVSKQVLIKLQNYKEYDICLPFIFSLMGYKTSYVIYEKRKTFNIKKQNGFSYIKEKILGYLNTTINPIHLITLLGAVLSVIFILALILSTLRILKVNGVTVFLCFIASLTILSVGLIGEYLGKIFIEIKKRPNYNIIETTNSQNE